MLNVGFENYVEKSKVLAITGLDSAPLKRKWQNAQDLDKLIDCTKGKRTLSLIHLVDGYIVGSATSAEKLKERMYAK